MQDKRRKLRYGLPMGLNVAPDSGQFVRHLVTHAGRLRRDASVALREGDHERAAALIEQAEILAADVRYLVDAMEERQTGEFMRLAVEQHAAATSRRSKPWIGARAKRVGAMIGAGLAISLALSEF
ncbi:hypothetical protein I603_0074 [Erythrobacter dokdonensis DSW-74]|uniref:Uncharacterized protein n=2 Tax=Erythrobacter TaxID=1041 RepID=A0A1A7BHB6_9SPHN|nr:hypothetical protein I603_0074 [Erythrobacter dokdonensis DSW-74]